MAKTIPSEYEVDVFENHLWGAAILVKLQVIRVQYY